MINLILLGAFWAKLWTTIKWIFAIIGAILLVAGVITSIVNNDDDVRITGIVCAIGGTIPCTFWLIIPHWNICQWFLLALIIAVTIIAYCKQYKTLFLITGIVTLVWITVALLVKVIVPFWAVTKWIIYALVAIGIIIGVYYLTRPIIQRIAKQRRSALLSKLRQTVSGLPVPNDAIFDYKSEHTAKKILKTLNALNLNLQSNSKDSKEYWKYKQQLNKIKLDIFYLISLRGESKENLNIYNAFKKTYDVAKAQNNYNLLRIDSNENAILRHQNTPIMNLLAKWGDVLKDDKTINYTEKLRKIKSMDTSGLFGFTSNTKLSQQTQAYADLTNAAIEETHELMQANTALNNALKEIRLCAYRNIYLGVELLNYLRDSAGGDQLTTEHSQINIPSTVWKNISIDFSTITNDYNRITDMASKGFDTAINSLRSLGFNPGVGSSIAIGGIAAIGAGFIEHASKVNANRQQQEAIVESLNQIIPHIQTGQAGLLRALEIMQAIVETNNGFMQIYAPLRDKVFVSHQPISEQDVNELMQATSAYQKISTSKI